MLSQEQINADLFDEVKRLKEELKESNRIIDVMDGHLVRNGKEIIDREDGRAELQWQVDRMREALEFYADAKIYEEIPAWIYLDRGDKARQLLEQLK